MKNTKEPIHKFNGGRGATLCHECRVIISEGLTDDLYCEEHGGRPQWKYKLVRERDGLTKKGKKGFWVEWNDNKTGKELHNKPKEKYSFILDPYYGDYTWLTTTVESIIEEREDYVKFKTENSVYELFISK